MEQESFISSQSELPPEEPPTGSRHRRRMVNEEVTTEVKRQVVTENHHHHLCSERVYKPHLHNRVVFELTTATTTPKTVL